jgi:hypothetical protein
MPAPEVPVPVLWMVPAFMTVPALAKLLVLLNAIAV